MSILVWNGKRIGHGLLGHWKETQKKRNDSGKQMAPKSISLSLRQWKDTQILRKDGEQMTPKSTLSPGAAALYEEMVALPLCQWKATQEIRKDGR